MYIYNTILPYNLRRYLLYFVRRDYKNAAIMWERALIEHPKELDVLSGFGSLQYHVYGALHSQL